MFAEKNSRKLKAMAHEINPEGEYKNGGEINGQTYSSDTNADEKEVKILVDSIRNGLNQVPSSAANYTICRVLKPVREVKLQAYTPRLVSIGPFHRYGIHLWPMEAHKLRLLNSFLARKQSKATLDDYVKEMRRSEKDARQCYAEVIPMKSDEFVRMMVVDGCFLLELVLKWKEHQEREWREGEDKGSDEEPHDPIFNKTWMPQIIRDLILLENQLPFFVLKNLYKIHIGSDSGFQALYDSATMFLKDTLHINNPKNVEGGRHLLDCVRHLLVSPSEEDKEKRPQFKQTDNCATKLKAMVKFEKSKTELLSDITFKEGVLTIPATKMDDLSESLLRNLIVLEQSPEYDDKYVTVYAFFMRDLIKSPEDVNFLQRKKIIESLINPEEVLALFNNLLHEVTMPDDRCFSNVYKKLDEYRKKTLNKYKAKFWRSIEILRTSYFKNTWSIISFVAATLLLSLTIAQTIASFKAL